MSSVDYGLKGKVAIVTGGRQGIGKSISLTLAEQGAKVVVANTNDKLHEGMLKELESRGVEALAVKTDVSKNEDVENMVMKAQEEFGRIDILVNNAGISPRTPLLEASEKDWDRVLDVNLKGVFLCTRAVVAEMTKQERKGKIVNIASTYGKIGLPKWSAYCASKFAVIGFTQSVAREFGPENIYVNAVCPGYNNWTPSAQTLLKEIIETDRLDREVLMDDLRNNVALTQRPFSEPYDTANLVCFLASDLSDYITGQAFNVCGGFVFH